jgi:hypothetical protein
MAREDSIVKILKTGFPSFSLISVFHGLSPPSCLSPESRSGFPLLSFEAEDWPG